MPDDARDGNEVQKEQASSRLRGMARDELDRAMESVGIDLRTPSGRRELRTRLDYLDKLYDDQISNRAALDWVRDKMSRTPKVEALLDWAAERMRIETSNRDAVRKTVVEKALGGLVWLLLGGLAAYVALLSTKGHVP